MSTIRKVQAYATEDGQVFMSLDEAAGHKYVKRLKTILGSSSVFGPRTLIENSRAIAEVLNAYNAEMDDLEKDQ
jgi:hypothetical protein